jgi:hypothetical protein
MTLTQNLNIPEIAVPRYAQKFDPFSVSAYITILGLEKVKT